MKFTVASPFLKVSFDITLVKNGIFVFTPLILNSSKVRLNLSEAPFNVLPLDETFTNIESKKGEIVTPE